MTERGGKNEHIIWGIELLEFFGLESPFGGNKSVLGFVQQQVFSRRDNPLARGDKREDADFDSEPVLNRSGSGWERVGLRGLDVSTNGFDSFLPKEFQKRSSGGER